MHNVRDLHRNDGIEELAQHARAHVYSLLQISAGTEYDNAECECGGLHIQYPHQVISPNAYMVPPAMGKAFSSKALHTSSCMSINGIFTTKCLDCFPGPEEQSSCVAVHLELVRCPSSVHILDCARAGNSDASCTYSFPTLCPECRQS